MRFPIEYGVELEKGATAPFRLHAAHRPEIAAGPPPEFGGGDVWWSPEHLLVASTVSCYAATLLAGLERGGIHVGTLRVGGKGLLSRASEGVMFSSISLAVEVHVVAGDVAQTRAAIERAKSQCFVARSLRCPVDVIADVRVS